MRLLQALFPDVTLSPTRMVVNKTGAEAPITPGLYATIGLWLRFRLVLGLACALRAPFVPRGPRVRFVPERPRPWYMVRSAVLWARMGVAERDNDEALTFAFNDATWAEHLPAGALNGDCADISKSRVAAAFEQAFGYSLALDPATHVGPAVEKGEVNGLHDGRIVLCPCPAVPGRVYQRLVDTEADGLLTDLRTQWLDGRPLFVAIKRRHPSDRFASIMNRKVVLREADVVFSAEEQAGIARFTALIGLDCGTLDILRDRCEGHIYIVDANKTDVGPVLKLSLLDQLRATAMLGRGLRALAEQRLRTQIRDPQQLAIQAG